MTRFDRRKFLRGWGLVATTPILASVERLLVREALGAPSNRRLAVFFVVGETIPCKDITPAGIVAGTTAKFDAVDRAGITWPAMFEGLGPWKDRTVILDGLYNQMNPTLGTGRNGGVQHGSGWGCLTGMRPDGDSPERGGTPTGISIDQFVAQRIGRDTPIPSILIGMNGKVPQDLPANTFAGGAGKPIAHVGKPSLLHSAVFGKIKGGGASGPSAADLQAQALRRSLLDSLRDDIRRLETRLAASERARLGEYLVAIEAYDKQQNQLTALAAGCGQPPAVGMDGPPAKRIEAMFGMATLAMKCGLTNVFGISIGSGFGHDDLALLESEVFGGGYAAHGEAEAYSRAMIKLYQWNTGLLGRMLRDLGPLADSAVVLMTAASGTTDSGHHANLARWFALVYDGTSTLKAAPGGRYLRYARGARSVVDLYASVAHAAGAPTDRFGTGFNKSQGPLPELLR